MSARKKSKRFYGIFLDDLHPKEIEAVNRPLRVYLHKTCTKRFLKRIWDAYLVHIYLQEVGHARHLARNCQRGSEDSHEDKAEEFAWRWMEKLFDKETVLGALALSWILGILGEELTWDCCT